MAHLVVVVRVRHCAPACARSRNASDSATFLWMGLITHCKVGVSPGESTVHSNGTVNFTLLLIC